MMTDIFSAFAALVFVLGLLGLFVWALKRFGLVPGHVVTGKASKQIKILENQMLDGKNRLVSMRWHDKDYLIGTGANGITVIDKRPAVTENTPETEDKDA